VCIPLLALICEKEQKKNIPGRAHPGEEHPELAVAVQVKGIAKGVGEVHAEAHVCALLMQSDRFPLP